MDAVVYHSPNGRITGAVVDALDYFAALRLNGRAIELHLIGLRRREVWVLLRDRYRHAEELWLAVRFHPSRLNLLTHPFLRVLAPYSAYQRVRHCLRAREVVILPTQVLRHHHQRGRIHDHPRNLFLLDPVRHPYEVARRKDYRKKLYLDDLPDCPDAADAVLVSTVSDHKRHGADALAEGLRQCEPYQEAIALSYARQSLLPDVRLLRPPAAGFFRRFNHYLYLPPLGGYDENPRLVFESRWLGKRLTLIASAESDAAQVERLRTGPIPRLEPDDLIFELFPRSSDADDVSAQTVEPSH